MPSVTFEGTAVPSKIKSNSAVAEHLQRFLPYRS